MMALFRKLFKREFYYISLALCILIACESSAIQKPSQVVGLNNERGVKETAQLSATTQELHNYSRQNEGFQQTTQYESRQHLRYIRFIFDPAVEYASVALHIKIATLPTSHFSEQQLSIPIFLRKLLI